jgi:transcriptional regulator with XRE-family HTH domain
MHLKDVKDRLKWARKRAKLSQEKLAYMTGLTQPTVQRLEKGKISSTTHLLVIARALNVSPDWLETGQGEFDISADANSKRSQLFPQKLPILKFSEIDNWLANPVIKPKHKVVEMALPKILSEGAFSVVIPDDALISPLDFHNSLLPGYLAVIEPTIKPELNEMALVEVADEKLLRKIATEGGTKVSLQALNPRLQNIPFDDNVKVIGKITAVYKVL